MNLINTGVFVVAILLLASVSLSKISGRLGLPALLLFIVIGMLAGSEGPGGIQFENYFFAQALGVVALAFILFDGGLSTDWRSSRPIIGKALALSTVGVAITAGAVGFFAKLVFEELSWLEALLLGSIVSSTDAAAVFGILRSRNASLKGNSQALLEFESGSNDPMAVFLTVGFISLISNPDESIFALVPMFAEQLLIGAAFGYGGGRMMFFAINRIRLQYEGLYPVLILAFVLLLYSISALLGGSGFLTTYMAGLYLCRVDFIHKKSLMRFTDGLSWIMQITMFLALGMLAFPSHLMQVAKEGLIIAFSLMFIARPVTVFLTMLPTKVSLRQKGIIAWVGLRGATPVILATFPLLAGVKNAEIIFNAVFFVVLISVLVQGSSIPFVAKLLGVYQPSAPARRPALEFSGEHEGLGQLEEIRISPSSPLVGKEVVELGLPQGVLIALLTRGNRYFVPRGDTRLKGDDILLILLAEPEKRDEIFKIFKN